jgi:hypothetical protein
MQIIGFAILVLGMGLAPLGAIAYPGGTPDFQTDVTPFCAACHSSIEESALAGARGDRAAKEVVEKKHLAPILAGANDYGTLDEPSRAKLVELIKAVDANSDIVLEFPPQVAPGETFQVTAKISGGAGPAVGVGLVDRAHRWYAKSAASVGWEIVGAPTIIGPKGTPQNDWLGRRPELQGRNITFVNVLDWKSDAPSESWANAKVIFTVKAPETAGNYPLVGVYFYGTEKAIPMSTKTNPVYGDQPLGGYTGKSGRVKFTPEHVITVK